MEKLVVICGPTATGKSDYAVNLAKKVGGEIISADSRQVYKGLDIGSGKITKRETKGVPHHLIDVASPRRTFSVAQYQRLAKRVVADILKRGKVPIVCGGTGLYIDALVHDTSFPTVPANKPLRRQLARVAAPVLFARLQTLDPKRAASIDPRNKVRLIRAIEIAEAIGHVPNPKRKETYDVEWIYLDFPDDVLKKRIHDRLLKRMSAGMVAEVRGLHEGGISWKRLESLGLEYRYLALFLQKKLSKSEMIQKLESEIWHYAKRQRTWFKKYTK